MENPRAEWMVWWGGGVREGGVQVCNKCDKERREWTGQSCKW